MFGIQDGRHPCRSSTTRFHLLNRSLPQKPRAVVNWAGKQMVQEQTAMVAAVLCPHEGKIVLVVGKREIDPIPLHYL